ncbi:slr1920 [Synechocystis sp. PCC 6803]|uniref:Slr1920 protein n=1 Tax=Synechocystis sp. (strain ATCC 27184 / PCC 6803 / Kazusa) TaxID=1111708 RepID=P73122_SYNY3|nr:MULTISPECIES: hypothetical protein [unclassified Synechocystis]BAM50866.1 hypothetical protein BEST7613_1935 [Synechocystis sp. PCC 6803] [Bacillus subtilis BEST7613]AGF50838.1 hypothetical protein MYO_15780 [Synechocystis sp. PCC 6803]ALJ66889.1 hypothetical protein AOY38_02940 [Synechocystis sp. PCC 6803]AVP88732.1 hypothetical protein C7I86_02960 [Synechocystis sp. IPPAS B-1465]MBD2617240.1 hypothetical protein [Synechocystis sp. FACHB-898]
MFLKIFQKKNNIDATPEAPAPEEQNAKSTLPGVPRVPIEEQKLLRRQCKQFVIDEFGKSVINLRLQKGILTPLHIVDLHKVVVPREYYQNPQRLIEQRVQECLEIHRQNLGQKLYRESFNLQPGHLLVAIKDIRKKSIVSFKDYADNLDKFLEIFNPAIHQLLLIRYFIPPVPDDMHQFDNIELPPQFEKILTDVINFCDLNYSLDNLTYDKWQALVHALDETGVSLNLVNKHQEYPFREMFTFDYGEIGYRKVLAKLLLKEKVEKRTVVIPLFVIMLAFFCSEPNARVSFPYHFLFTATGDAKKRSMEKGKISFFKLFNQLLDESLTQDQLSKCLAVIHNEVFQIHQMEIDDLLLGYRQKHNAMSGV